MKTRQFLTASFSFLRLSLIAANLFEAKTSLKVCSIHIKRLTNSRETLQVPFSAMRIFRGGSIVRQLNKQSKIVSVSSRWSFFCL